MQIQTPPLGKVNKGLLIALVAGLVGHHLSQGAGFSLHQILGLSWPGLKSGMVFQILTYPLAIVSLMGLLFNGLVLWFIGGELELLWGSKRYGELLFWSVLFGAAAFLLISYFFPGMDLLLGAQALTLGPLIAYAMLFPRRQFLFMFIFPLEARYFCLLLVAIEVYIGLTQTSAAGAFGHLGAMAAGFLFTKGKLPSLLRGGGRSRRKRRRKKKSHLSLVGEEYRPDDDKNEPKYWQ